VIVEVSSQGFSDQPVAPNDDDSAWISNTQGLGQLVSILTWLLM
jgi:hypothetical protein